MGEGDPQYVPWGVVGTARLPRTLAGEQSALLIIELTFDPVTRVIANVASTLQLPCYQVLLHSLIGIKLGDLGAAGRRVFANYRGPLMRPTLAALSNALANVEPTAIRDVSVANVTVPSRNSRHHSIGIGRIAYAALDDSGSS